MYFLIYDIFHIYYIPQVLYLLNQILVKLKFCKFLTGSNFLLALVQMTVKKNKPANLNRCAEFVRIAAQSGAKIVALPECFNSPYGTSKFNIQ